jgi:hypothetical protein
MQSPTEPWIERDMGMGTPDGPNQTVDDWNSGSCDVMAVALHRMYGFPVMARFEWGFDGGREALGYLCHAWVRLPDGRDLDAGGPRRPFGPSRMTSGPNDPWVRGYRIVEIRDDDPHLLASRDEDDYVESIRVSGANSWIRKHLGQELASLGLLPTVQEPVVSVYVSVPDQDVETTLESGFPDGDRRVFFTPEDGLDRAEGGRGLPDQANQVVIEIRLPVSAFQPAVEDEAGFRQCADRGVALSVSQKIDPSSVSVHAPDRWLTP